VEFARYQFLRIPIFARRRQQTKNVYRDTYVRTLSLTERVLLMFGTSSFVPFAQIPGFAPMISADRGVVSAKESFRGSLISIFETPNTWSTVRLEHITGPCVKQ